MLADVGRYVVLFCVFVKEYRSCEVFEIRREEVLMKTSVVLFGE